MANFPDTPTKSGRSKKSPQFEITESPDGFFNATSSKDDPSKQEVIESGSNENSSEGELWSGPQAETNDYEYSSTDDESPATTSVKKPSLSRPTEFVALVPDPRRRRDIIDNAELKEVKAAFQQAASCWVPVANRYIKLQKDLPAMQCNASLDENDLVDAACLAQGAGFPVRVPWRKNLKIRDIKDSGITDHELRDELMDVFEARQMFIERNEKLKIDIKARKAENVRVAELEATQRAIRISLGISKPDFTHRDGTR